MSLLITISDILHMEAKHCVDRLILKFGSFVLRRKISVCGLFAEFRSERLDRDLAEY